MKITSSKLLTTAIAGLALLPFNFCPAVVVVLSGNTDAAGTANLNQLETFLYDNFSNVTEVRKGNFSNLTTAEATTALNGADLVIVGRTLASANYQGANAKGFNTLNIPVISLTSYISRSAGDRLGWHTGEATHIASSSVAGAETSVTAAGSTIFNLTLGSHDFFANNGGDTFNGLGDGALGGGTLLASMDGKILAARWDAGAAPGDTTAATVATFPAPRLLFNLDNDPVEGSPGGTLPNDLATLTETGRSALISSFATMGLTPVPEPSTALMLVASLLGWGVSRRR